MTTEPKTSMAANNSNTAIRVHTGEVSKTIDDVLEEPDFVAVLEDANAVVAGIERDQSIGILQRSAIVLGITSGSGLAAMVTIMVATRNFDLSSHWAIAAFGMVLGLALLNFVQAKDISPDGIAIDRTVYEHLTPEDRNALFEAQAESGDVLHALLAMLKERYTAQESQQRVAKQQQDRARAATILASHEPLA